MRYSILTELQIFHLSRYATAPRKLHRGKDDTYTKKITTSYSYLFNDTSYKKIHFSYQIL